MESEFVHRKNIEHFEQLLASGTLSAGQALVVSGLLATEVEALAQLANTSEPLENLPRRLNS